MRGIYGDGFISGICRCVFGFILGILPGMVKEKFPDDTDERTAMIRTNLPGNNCGGCGFAGCDAFAAAVADDKVTADKCTGGISRCS